MITNREQFIQDLVLNPRLIETLTADEFVEFIKSADELEQEQILEVIDECFDIIEAKYGSEPIQQIVDWASDNQALMNDTLDKLASDDDDALRFLSILIKSPLKSDIITRLQSCDIIGAALGRFGKLCNFDMNIAHTHCTSDMPDDVFIMLCSIDAEATTNGINHNIKFDNEITDINVN